ncbi:MAG TPA: 5-formyltetrahydrofolate cyclo-ligase [Actinomycetota bacterium]|nr:5-formyltetrahydrofolate cyclo-ligase [Actinomycetota bacterium]
MPEGPGRGSGVDERVARAKQEVRERVWRLLEERGAARFPGARGRIPNFRGVEEAAHRLATLPEWQRARVLKANPDAAQLPVRARALAEGKRLYVAVPRLREERPFLLLEPGRLQVPPRRAVTIRGAATHGRPVRVDELEPVDLVVCGSVAVNRSGVRVGKGGGFSDLEFGLLVEAGLVGEGTVIATTVHRLQVVDEDLPETEHDFRVDLVVTPSEVIRTPRARRPLGILWEHLTEEKVAEVPALAAVRGP